MNLFKNTALVALALAAVTAAAFAADPAKVPACCVGGNCCASGKCCTMAGCCKSDKSCCDPAKGACTSACGCLTMNCCPSRSAKKTAAKHPARAATPAKATSAATG